jgi:hypothetical protein
VSLGAGERTSTAKHVPPLKRIAWQKLSCVSCKFNILMALMCNQTRHHRAEADLSMPSTSVNKAGHPYHMRLAARTVAPNPTMLGLLKGYYPKKSPAP